jgi:hypothetical protein
MFALVSVTRILKTCLDIPWLVIELFFDKGIQASQVASLYRSISYLITSWICILVEQHKKGLIHHISLNLKHEP